MIRARTEADLTAVVTALTEVARTDNYPSPWPEDPVAWVRTRDAREGWVAERDGEIVGHVVLRHAGSQRPVALWAEASGADPGTCAVISRLFVVTAGRGQGLGQALLQTASTAAAARGLRAVLDVVDTNRAAVRLYQRLGWSLVGSYEERFSEDGPLERLHCFVAPTG